MPVIKLTIPEEFEIGRIQRVIDAVILTEDVPPNSAKTLRNHIKAVRLFAEAGERAQAKEVLSRLMTGVVGQEWAEMVLKHCRRLQDIWRVEEKR